MLFTDVRPGVFSEVFSRLFYYNRITKSKNDVFDLLNLIGGLYSLTLWVRQRFTFPVQDFPFLPTYERETRIPIRPRDFHQGV